MLRMNKRHQDRLHYLRRDLAEIDTGVAQDQAGQVRRVQ